MFIILFQVIITHKWVKNKNSKGVVNDTTHSNLQSAITMYLGLGHL